MAEGLTCPGFLTEKKNKNKIRSFNRPFYVKASFLLKSFYKYSSTRNGSKREIHNNLIKLLAS